MNESAPPHEKLEPPSARAHSGTCVGGNLLKFPREFLLAESESTGFRPEILEKALLRLGFD